LLKERLDLKKEKRRPSTRFSCNLVSKNQRFLNSRTPSTG
jgi:hypothetical protein